MQCLEPDFDPGTDWSNIWMTSAKVVGICYDVVIGHRAYRPNSGGRTVRHFVTEDGGTSWAFSNMGVESGPGDTPHLCLT